MTLTTEDFVSKAKTLHGTKYAYDNVMYRNSRTDISISCPQHGDFWQRPNHHLSGRGCPACGQETSASKTRSNTIDFVSKAKTLHGTKYAYDNVMYRNSRTKVLITCQKHGNFRQTPNDHLKGQGCPACGQEAAHSYYHEPTILYYTYLPTLDVYKIGITLERIGIAKRFANDKIPLIIISTRLFADGIEAYEIEQLLHYKYQRFQYTESKPLIGGNSELFAIPYEELKDVYETFTALKGHIRNPQC